LGKNADSEKEKNEYEILFISIKFCTVFFVLTMAMVWLISKIPQKCTYFTSYNVCPF
jgi:hypothetical protein